MALLLVEPAMTNPRTYLYKDEKDFVQLNMDSSMGTPQHKMCSVIVNGRLYLMGGENNHKRSRYRLDPCGFTQLSDLHFDFDGGQCTSIENGKEALLCASLQSPEKCGIWDGIGWNVVRRYGT